MMSSSITRATGGKISAHPKRSKQHPQPPIMVRKRLQPILQQHDLSTVGYLFPKKKEEKRRKNVNWLLLFGWHVRLGVGMMRAEKRWKLCVGVILFILVWRSRIIGY
jgi:hypothetical protein